MSLQEAEEESGFGEESKFEEESEFEEESRFEDGSRVGEGSAPAVYVSLHCLQHRWSLVAPSGSEKPQAIRRIPRLWQIAPSAVDSTHSGVLVVCK